ncbi:hypothetical protein PROFUN_04148 [Planoprotostelium fungivorum]|uniref:S1-like domain-containing protein n=1 Tax=Planoprotostelium fungivorum TaxID=1890364 RepID=A0A2P6NJP0_9EUKA|nr:hypothetical protein PROFUN_04148 [Planoprotostelium fungivorum]
MSHSRKHLRDAHLNSYPEPKENEQIARVIDLRGANMCDVELSQDGSSIAVIPTRFRKLIWIKKGHYLIVKVPTDYKAQCMVEHVLSDDQIEHLIDAKLWPDKFPIGTTTKATKEEENEEEEEDDMLRNPNHRVLEESSDDDDEEDDEEEEEDNT